MVKNLLMVPGICDGTYIEIVKTNPRILCCAPEATSEKALESKSWSQVAVAQWHLASAT